MRLVTLTIVMVTMSSGLEAQTRPSTLAGRSAVFAPHGVIASSQPLASAAGLAVMERGGNAIDAAVTAVAVLNVVEPHMTGIGGDMFALLWSAKEKKLVGLNGSGRAGSLMTREELVRRGFKEMPVQGPETITVPGALAGWAALLEKYGTITLAQALEPAIRIAEEGFPVSPVIAFEWDSYGSALTDPGFLATYMIDGKRGPKAGEWFRNPDIAKTFRTIAAQGPSAFYGGTLGQQIVDHVRKLGGFLTLDDLRNNRPDWIDPISVPYKGYRVWELPPNGQGIAALEMLRILEPYDLKGMGQNSAKYLHYLIEAKKLAFADIERYVGDPAAMTEKPAYFLSDAFIAKRRAALDPHRAAQRYEPGPSSTASETIYLTAADAQGNMVSFICSLFDAFGSGIVVPGTGFALQNRGNGFTLTPGLPNTVGRGKRVRHTIIPAFVTRTTPAGEEPWMSFGVMGGAMQPQGHVQVILNMLEFGMNPQQAVDAPRFRHMAGRQVILETPIGDAVRDSLRAMGHQVEDPPAGKPQMFGGGQAIVRLTRGWMAGSDPRKDGAAFGY